MAVLAPWVSRARLARSAAGEAAQQRDPPSERQRYSRCVPGHYSQHREQSPEAVALLPMRLRRRFCPRMRPTRRRMSLYSQGPAVPRCPQD